MNKQPSSCVRVCLCISSQQALHIYAFEYDKQSEGTELMAPSCHVWCQEIATAVGSFEFIRMGARTHLGWLHWLFAHH